MKLLSIFIGLNILNSHNKKNIMSMIFTTFVKIVTTNIGYLYNAMLYLHKTKNVDE